MLKLEARTEQGDFVGIDVYDTELRERVGWIELEVKGGKDVTMEYAREDEARFGPIKMVLR